MLYNKLPKLSSSKQDIFYYLKDFSESGIWVWLGPIFCLNVSHEAAIKVDYSQHTAPLGTNSLMW